MKKSFTFLFSICVILSVVVFNSCNNKPTPQEETTTSTQEESTDTAGVAEDKIQPKVVIVVKDNSNKPVQGASVSCDCFTPDLVKITDATGKVTQGPGGDACSCNGFTAYVTKSGMCTNVPVNITSCTFSTVVICQ